MGTICNKNQPQIFYKSVLKDISSTISQNPAPEHSQVLQLMTLTSQNQESILQQINLADSKKESVKKSLGSFKPIHAIGKGAFGQVFLVKEIQTSKTYAMKVIYKDTIKNKQQKNNALSQRYLLETMNNPFIVKLHYAFQSKSKLYLFVDFMAGGQLFYLLRRQKKFEQSVARFYAAQILLALQYLHERNVIYRDLKPENILLTKQGHIKLADFGLSKICFNRNQLAFSICGTPQYIAPQIIQGKGYDQSADWFSFGSVVYDMLTGRPPFFSKNKHQILYNITSKKVPIPQYLSQQAKSLLKLLFQIKPANRLGFKGGAKQIKQHIFFKQINFEDLKLQLVAPPIRFDNCEINQQGFDLQLNQSTNKIQIELSKQEIIKEGIFKDFQYVKPDNSASFSQKCQSNQFILKLQQYKIQQKDELNKIVIFNNN